MNSNTTTRRIQPYPSPINTAKPVLRTHKHAIWLLILYIPLVVIPWVVTLVMVYRPLTRPSWTHASGFWQRDYDVITGWARAIPIMNACAAVIAVTVSSAVVAQAAVVFAQRRHAGQRLSVRQLFSLADRAWCDLGALPRTAAKGNAAFKCFVLGAAALVGLGAVQYPLLQILVSWDEISVPNCQNTKFIQEREYDNRHCDAKVDVLRGGNYRQLGRDLEPAQLALVPAFQILPRIRTEISQYVAQTTLEHLWQEESEFGDRPAANMQNIAEPGFVAALPTGSTTGVLRQHLLRLSSNVTCTNTTVSEFPSTCTGTNPFQGSWDYYNSYTSYNGTLDICAPGDMGKHPWMVSRNRQDITEELFLKYREVYHSQRFDNTRVNEEMFHCKAETARGYFELGNVYNGGQYGPLLNKWPSNSSRSQFHDYFEREWGSGVGTTSSYFPSEEDHGTGAATATPDPVGRYDYYAPEVYTNVTGPLMTSVLALFGSYSWANAVVNTTTGKSKPELQTSLTTQEALLTPLCHLKPYRHGASTLRTSYTELRCTENLAGLRSTLDDFLSDWSVSASRTATKLRAAVFFANRALLTVNTGDNALWQPWTGREIYTAPGWTVQRPRIALAAQIILSLILALHVLGLVMLVFLILKYPAWTRTLDALAVARVAARIDTSLLPPMQATTRKDSVGLDAVDGLVGVCHTETENQHHHHHHHHHHQYRNTDISHPRGLGPEPPVPTDRDIEMDTLSVASTAGKEPTTTAMLAPACDESVRVSLGLGAPGVLPRRVRVDVPPRPLPPAV